MAVKTFSVGELATSADVNLYLANAGLVYVTQVTIGTGVSSVNVTSCFSSTYDNYVLSYAGITASNGGVPLTLKLLSGSTPTTSGFYGNTYYCSTGVASTINNANTTNAAFTEGPSISSAYLNAGIVDIQSPYLATNTQFQYSGCDQTFWRMGASYHNSATSYNGIQLVPWTGTYTGGTVTIYGRRKG